MRRALLATVSVWVAGAAILRVTLAPAGICPDVSEAELRSAASEAAAWIERAQRPDGTYLYEYHRTEGEIASGYNPVRHAGVTMSLYQMAAEGRFEALPAADRGMRYMRTNLHVHRNWVAFRQPGGAVLQLGSSALMLVGLEHRRIATNDRQYDEIMRELGHFLVTMQRSDGSFLANWVIAESAPDESLTSKYATGEAFWALALLHEAFPGEGWDRPTLLVADYLATRRDAAEDLPYPPWADQWAAYGLGTIADWGLNDGQVAYARSLAERFGFLVRVESGRRDSRVSRLLRGPQARAAGLGTWVEGLAALHHAATVEPRLSDLRAKIGERARCGSGMLVRRQVSAAQAADPQAIGAWFDDDVTRMDDQQHALSGLLLSAPIVQTSPR